MSTSFNNIVATRDAGSLLAAPSFDQVIISNCTIGALKIDRGHEEVQRSAVDGITRVPIEPDIDNLPINAKREDWSLNTELFAQFNGDLEAGPLSFYGKNIDSIIVKKTSNRKGFSEWEDLKVVKNIKENVNEDYNYTFYDQAVENGIIYLYGIQPISKTERGSLYKGLPSAVVYEDIFLVGENGKQLKIRFNPNISSIKTNIKESRVETIGSKYPYITRNGNVKYKEMPLSGTITHYMDPLEEFAPRGEIFIEDELADLIENVDLSSIYDNLYASNNRDDSNNEIMEREFRNKVIDFLQDGKPKLFKSPTENPMIVKVMDVNITPNQQLGRMICDFSCNLVEVDKYSLENLDKYRIQIVGSKGGN